MNIKIKEFIYKYKKPIIFLGLASIVVGGVVTYISVSSNFNSQDKKSKPIDGMKIHEPIDEINKEDIFPKEIDNDYFMNFLSFDYFANEIIIGKQFKSAFIKYLLEKIEITSDKIGFNISDNNGKEVNVNVAFFKGENIFKKKYIISLEDTSSQD